MTDGLEWMDVYLDGYKLVDIITFSCVFSHEIKNEANICDNEHSICG